MRTSLWLAITLLASTALSGCGDPVAAGKQGNNAAASGKEEVTIRMAHATEQGGDLEGARKLYEQAVAREPDAVVPRAELAEFYLRRHEDEKAIATLNEAQRLAPENTDIAREIANTYISTGRPEQALPVLDRAIALNNRMPLLYNSKGVALDQMGSYREAQQAYKRAYDLDPAGGTTYKINISMSYILSGSYDKAIAILRPMLDMGDAPANVRQNLALAYGMKGDSETALKLGLEDLTTAEAEENLRFYRMLAAKHGHGGSHSTAGTEPVPASVVNELFPSADSAAAAQPDVIVPPEPAPAAVPSAPVSTIATPTGEVQQIVVTPTVVTPATVPPAVQTTVVTTPPPAPHVSAPKPKMKKPVEEDSDDDDSDDTQSAMPTPTMPQPTMQVPPTAASTVPPDESPLPEPVLKPDSH